MDVFVRSEYQVFVDVQELDVQFFESPRLLHPDGPGQVEHLMVLENVHHHFGPVTINAVVGVVLPDLVQRRQLWLEFAWYFVEQHYALALFLDFLYGFLVVENFDHLVVVHPGH